MGQGIYQMIVFGAIKPPTYATDEQGYTDAAEWYQKAAFEAEKRRSVVLDSSYEAVPFYRGAVVAVSDKVLAKSWGVPCLARHVIPADDLLGWITNHALPQHDRAIAAWEDIRAAGREVGVEVPEGKLLLVSDWD
jgi:hypothetical protein